MAERLASSTCLHQHIISVGFSWVIFRESRFHNFFLKCLQVECTYQLLSFSRDFYSKPGAYSQSKTAQIMFTRYLDNKLSSENIPVRCYAMHPGFINSNLYTQTWWARSLTLFFGCMFRVIWFHCTFICSICWNRVIFFRRKPKEESESCMLRYRLKLNTRMEVTLKIVR